MAALPSDVATANFTGTVIVAVGIVATPIGCTITIKPNVDYVTDPDDALIYLDPLPPIVVPSTGIVPSTQLIVSKDNPGLSSNFSYTATFSDGPAGRALPKPIIFEITTAGVDLSRIVALKGATATINAGVIIGGGGGGTGAWDDLTGKPAVIAAGTDAAAARAAIGAGTSNLATGTTSGTARDAGTDVPWDDVAHPLTMPPSAHTTQPADIVGSTSFGQSLLELAAPSNLRNAAGAGTAGSAVFAAESGSDIRTTIGAAASSDLAAIRQVPSGGTTGQVLVKQSGTDGDATFQTFAAGNVFFIVGAGSARVHPVDGSTLPSTVSVFWRADSLPAAFVDATDVWINAPAS